MAAYKSYKILLNSMCIAQSRLYLQPSRNAAPQQSGFGCVFQSSLWHRCCASFFTCDCYLTTFAFTLLPCSPRPPGPQDGRPCKVSNRAPASCSAILLSALQVLLSVHGCCGYMAASVFTKRMQPLQYAMCCQYYLQARCSCHGACCSLHRTCLLAPCTDSSRTCCIILQDSRCVSTPFVVL